MVISAFGMGSGSKIKIVNSSGTGWTGIFILPKKPGEVPPNLRASSVPSHASKMSMEMGVDTPQLVGSTFVVPVALLKI